MLVKNECYGCKPAVVQLTGKSSTPFGYCFREDVYVFIVDVDDAYILPSERCATNSRCRAELCGTSSVAVISRCLELIVKSRVTLFVKGNRAK